MHKRLKLSVRHLFLKSQTARCGNWDGPRRSGLALPACNFGSNITPFYATISAISWLLHRSSSGCCQPPTSSGRGSSYCSTGSHPDCYRSREEVPITASTSSDQTHGNIITYKIITSSSSSSSSSVDDEYAYTHSRIINLYVPLVGRARPILA